MNSKMKLMVGLLWALLATALWGATFLGPVAVEPVGSIYLVFGRYFVFGILSLIVLALNARKLPCLGRANILAALHLGVFGYIGFYLFFSLSASVGGGALASIVTGVMAAFVTIASNIVNKEVRWSALALPIVITSIGVLIVNLQPTSSFLGKNSSDFLIATALSLTACAFWAYFVIVNGIILKRHNGPKIDNNTWTALIGIGAFCASFLLLPFAGLDTGTSPFHTDASLPQYLIVIVLLATLGSWCASWTWNIAAKSLSTIIMGQLIALETIFGVFFNLLWEQRFPTVQETTGAAFVFFGVILCVRVFDKNA